MTIQEPEEPEKPKFIHLDFPEDIRALLKHFCFMWSDNHKLILEEECSDEPEDSDQAREIEQRKADALAAIIHPNYEEIENRYTFDFSCFKKFKKEFP